MISQSYIVRYLEDLMKAKFKVGDIIYHARTNAILYVYLTDYNHYGLCNGWGPFFEWMIIVDKESTLHSEAFRNENK